MSTTIQPDRDAFGKGELSPAVSSQNKVTLRRVILSYSIASLCFIYIWTRVLAFAGGKDYTYFGKYIPSVSVVWALVADISLLAAVLFFAFRLRDARQRVARGIGTALLVLLSGYALYDLLSCLLMYLQMWISPKIELVIYIATAALLLAVLLSGRRRAESLSTTFFLLLSPLFPLLLLNALWMYHTSDLGRLGGGAAAGMLSTASHSNRAIWIIFDELDEKLLFDKRAPRLHLTEFDWLREHSLFGDHVTTPNGDTLPSMPSLIMGRTIVDDVRTQTANLRFQFAGCSQWLDFKSHANVFSRARAAGFNTAISGWNHPYCRVIGADLSDCAWESNMQTMNVALRSLSSARFYQKAAYLAKWQARRVPDWVADKWGISPLPQGFRGYRDMMTFTTEFVWRNGLRMLKNPKLNLVLLHLPPPHPPGFWDSSRHTYTSGDSGYIDNLDLADELMGQIRRTLEQTGDWDRSTIVVSADHSYRPNDDREVELIMHGKRQPYVPYFVKLPFQHQGIRYERPLNSVITGDLLLDVLKGDVRTPEDAVKWLDAHAMQTSGIHASSCP